jgi:hypothetical protein
MAASAAESGPQSGFGECLPFERRGQPLLEELNPLAQEDQSTVARERENRLSS